MSILNSAKEGFWVEQDKDAVLDYSLDWSDWVEPGDSIASSDWSCADPSVILTNKSISGMFTTVFISGGAQGGNYLVVNTVTTTAGRTEQKVVRLSVVDESILYGRGFFDNPSQAVDIFRNDYLPLVANGYLDTANLRNSFILQKLKAAEAQLQRDLGIPLSRTEIFTEEPTVSELAALDGRPYIVEPGYDMSPDFLSVSKWGMLKLRYRPVIEIKEFKLVYPNQAGASFTIPLTWMRVDKKYGQLIVAPSAQAVTAPYSVFVMQALTSGMSVPDMIRVKYSAGIERSNELYPDVVDLIYRLAIVSMLKGTFAPSSGSVSADGFSQSSSFDIQKTVGDIQSEIERVRQSLTGITWGVL